MKLKGLVMRSDAVDFLASRISSRNLVRHSAYSVSGAMVAARWRSRCRRGDLSCLLTDHFVQPGSVAVDVGASWGFFSYHLARRVGPRGLLYSYEPHPANAPGLRKLARAQAQVRFTAAAVSDARGNAQLAVPRVRFRAVTAQSSLAHEFDGIVGVETDSVTVPTVRLDDEIAPSVSPEFIKIDVEGHELAVLRGAEVLLQRCQPALLIEVEQRHLNVPITSVFEAILDLGYNIFYISGSTLEPLSNFDLERDQLSNVVPGQFTPFDMPEGYVNEFVAVASMDQLEGVTISRA